MAGVIERIKSGWNAFRNQEEAQESRMPLPETYGASSGYRPDRTRMRFSNERSIVASVYTRIGIDVSAIDLRHVRLGDNDQYQEDVKSRLGDCLTVEANLDQAARAFRQDMAMSLCDEGVIAIVPVDTTEDPNVVGSWDVKTMRVGRIVQWYPHKVRVRVYDDRADKGLFQEVLLDKKHVAIVENPLYSVMNEPNSTLRRLIRKLNILDAIDEQSGSQRLDLIIQLPYVIKNEQKREQADKRRKEIEFQLRDSQYGIAYTDGTEKITQLNRPAENNLLKQIEFLTNMLYGQLGLTEEIMNGTADEKAMLNYFNRTIEPITDAIVEEMRRKFLTKTARSQGQSIIAWRNPFKLVPVENIAEIADKFTRNEIMSANEIRSIIGFRPSTDPKADELRNSNMPAPADSGPSAGPTNNEEVGDNNEGT